MARDEFDWKRVLMELGVKPSAASKWAPHLAEQINDDTFSAGLAELPAFLSHLLHESGMLEKVEENLNYSARRIREIGMASKPGTRWRSLVAIADDLEYNPRAFAEAVYGGRMGNDQPGDGYKHRGMGPGQLTGKNNHRMMGEMMGVDLVDDPEKLLDPHYGLRAFILFWEANVSDDAALSFDARDDTIEVNGGVNGLKHRQELQDLAREVLAS